MEHFAQALGDNRGSIAGTAVAFVLGFVGKLTLSDTALITGILSGAVTVLYTTWKWRQEYRKHHQKKVK